MEVSKLLAKKGFGIIIITEHYDETLKMQEKLGNILIYRMSIPTENWFKKFFIWAWLWRHRTLMQKADIIHCHDVFFWYLPFRFLFWRKPVYITFHGYESYPVKKSAIAIRKLSEILSWGNICIGGFIKKWYSTIPTYATWGGVEISKSNHLESLGKELKILFLGRLEEENAVKIYLNCLELLKTQGIKFNFLACGDGLFRKQAERYGRVLGFVKDTGRYIADANVVFASSYLSMLEAMVSGRLVFAGYDNPVKKDYLKMSPFSKYIITANSPNVIKDKILYYLKHPSKMRNKIMKSRKWANNQSWDHVVETYLKLWRISN